MTSPPRLLLGHSVLLLLPLLASAAGLVLEDGYTVSTAADLNPRPPAKASSGPHPYALLPRPRAGDLVLLDSAGSALYTLPLPVSAGGEPPRRRATGGPAAADAFDRPRSIAVDGADNVYVADRAHGAIRKEISMNRFSGRIRKHYKRTQRKAAPINFSEIKNAVANSMLYTLLLKLVRVSLGYLTVVLPSFRPEQGVPCKPSPSLLDLDKTPYMGLDNKALPSTELLGDFISFDDDNSREGNESTLDGGANTQEGKEPSLDSDLWALLDNPQSSSKKIDSMIEANLSDFSGQEKYSSSAVNCSKLSRRRVHGDSEAL